MASHLSDSLGILKRIDNSDLHGFPPFASLPLENLGMETSAERRKRRLQWLAGKHTLIGIAAKAQVSHAALDQILKGVLLPAKSDGSRSAKSLGNQVAQQIEEVFELGRGWFDLPGSQGMDSPRLPDAPAYLYRDASDPGEYFEAREAELQSLAHQLSDHRVTLPLKRIVVGGQVEENELPTRFELQMLDDSLVGFIEQGEWAICSRTAAPRIGKAVLVLDGQNRPYLRKLEQGMPHEQFAVATKPGYRAMPIGPGGVRIIAAVMGSYFDEEESS